jgi:DNA-binding NarL/FixJ family response regulator
LKRLRILIVDDHLIVRQGLRSIMNGERDMEVVGEFGSGEEALGQVQQLAPDVALVDVRMPGMSGVDLCRRMRELAPQTAVVILTSFLNEELVRECIQAGARGYLLKDVGEFDLVRGVRAVMAGEAAISPKAASLLVDWVLQKPDPGTLSADELVLLRKIARGMTNREVAAELFVSDNTVKDRVLDLFRKLKVKGRVEAVMEGVRRGLL